MENLFTIKQAAFILKVHQLTVRRYIREKKLSAVKVGGGVRIRERNLLDFQKNYVSNSSGVRPGIQKIDHSFSFNDPFWKLNGIGASLTLP